MSTTTYPNEPAYSPAGNPSLSELVSGIVADGQQLFRQQIEMVKAEFKEDMRRTLQTVVAIGVGVGLIALGALFLVISLVFVLKEYTTLPLWSCWAIVGGTIVLAGGIAVYIGSRILASFNPLPDKSLHALQENVSWITKRQN